MWFIWQVTGTGSRHEVDRLQEWPNRLNEERLHGVDRRIPVHLQEHGWLPRHWFRPRQDRQPLELRGRCQDCLRLRFRRSGHHWWWRLQHQRLRSLRGLPEAWPQDKGHWRPQDYRQRFTVTKRLRNLLRLRHCRQGLLWTDRQPLLRCSVRQEVLALHPSHGSFRFSHHLRMCLINTPQRYIDRWRGSWEEDDWQRCLQIPCWHHRW